MTDEQAMPESEPEKNVDFNSSVEATENALIVSYELTNSGKTDIYLLDIIPKYDLETRQPSIDLNNGVAIWNEPDGLSVIRGLPPYPTEKDMAAYYTPLASKIGPGEKLNRRIELSLPLVESSPYYSPLDIKTYESATVTTIRLSVHFIRSRAEGFEAQEVAFAKDVYFVKSKFLLRDVQKFSKEYRIAPVAILKYPATFTRVF